MSTTDTHQANQHSEFKQDVREMRNDASTIKHSMGDLAHHAADAAKDGVSELRDGAEHAMDAAKDKFEEGKQVAKDKTESFRRAISNNPLMSVGIAASAGAVVALIMFRRG